MRVRSPPTFSDRATTDGWKILPQAPILPSMEDPRTRLARHQQALEAFLERIEEDRNILAVVRIGSLTEELIWKRDRLRLWLIEADKVTRRLKSDGDEPRIFRWFYEEGVRLRAELIPRAQLKRMVEGSARTAFSFNHFATRALVYSRDPSIAAWFAEANTIAERDRDHERMRAFSWVVWSARHARRLLELRGQPALARSELLGTSFALALIAVIDAGEICESELIPRGQQLAPALFEAVYAPLLRPASEEELQAVLAAVDAWVAERGEALCAPVLRVLRKRGRVVPLSELGDHFATSQLWPDDLEAALDWLVRTDRVERVAAPFRITKKSRVEVEEPAYIIRQG